MKLWLGFFLGIVFIFAACNRLDDAMLSDTEPIQLKSASIQNKYIVVMHDDDSKNQEVALRNQQTKAKAYGLLKKLGIQSEPEEIYSTALSGFTVRINPAEAKKLGDDFQVKQIEEDQVISLSPIVATGKPTKEPPAQSVPWGIARIGGFTNGSGKLVWIIDSGIDLDHPDLNVDVNLSRTFVAGTSSADDQNGHGTHVAGTIAALDNNIGVVGVAAGAKVVAVRVLDRRGSGSISGVISGVDYVAANASPGDVANMSLGGGASPSLDQAVLNASSMGIKFALAAGNDAINASNSSPARVNGPNIYTVSAMDSTDKWAYFSNFGNPPVDYCAPGVSVYSTYKGGGYATLSGTSMAAPHVAGILALGTIQSNGTVSGDPDGNPDPIAHR